MKARISDSLLRAKTAPGFALEIYDSIEAGLVARLRPSGHVSFWLYENRGRKKTKLGTWPKLNTKRARKLCRAEKEAKATTPSVPTLETFLVETYIPAFELEHKNLKYIANLKRFRKNFPDLELMEFTEDFVEDWRSRLIAQGIKHSTINRYVAALKAVLSYAYRKRFIPDHPLKFLRQLREEIDHRIRFLSTDEEQSLRRNLVLREWRIKRERESANRWRRERGYDELPELKDYKYADHLRPMVLLSLNTGLRQGELFNLQWQHINNGFLTVPATNAKSRRTRHIPLNNEALEALNGWKPLSGSTGYVFQGRVGRFDNVRNAWNRILNEAGIVDFRWHDMRHHFASQLVMKGIPLNTVRELLGHADLKTTMRYAHLAPNHLREAVGVLDAK